MNHSELVRAITCLYPGAEWSYDGDGTTLEPVYDDDELVAAGLVWHDAQPAPTLELLSSWQAPPPVPDIGAIVTGADGSVGIVTASDPATGEVSVAPLAPEVSASPAKLTRAG